ncbi:MAG: HAMP domain-containing protein [Deltaproteobacteria bacterium]|nr:HAMP domain-containing protein [Deltaproteobacteria bacterium]
MSLKGLLDLRHTLAFRLTCWYAGVFMVSSAIAFLLFYLLITSVIRGSTDQDLISKVHTFSSVLTTRGIDAVTRQAILEAQAAGEKKMFFRFLYPSGTAFSSSNMVYWRNIGVGRAAVRRLIEDGEPVFDTIRITDRKLQVRVLYAILGPGIILQLGQSMENYTRIIDVFRRIFVTTMAGLFVFGAIIGWFLARRALMGVENVTRTARRISEGSLEERVPVKQGEDEIDQLANTFNQMLDRIQGLVTGIKEMSDNIAHDLKSHITRIRGTAEVTLTTGTSLKEFEKMAADTIEECDRLMDMINTMLFISKTETGVDAIDRRDIDLAEILRDACFLFQSPAEDRGVTLTCNTPDHLPFYGDVRLIQRMVANLLDNAIKYTPSGGKVNIKTVAGDERAVHITVADNGMGISEKDLPHIFERFYRDDPSRSEAGSGLGLSLARAVSRAHGGDISVTSTRNLGSTFHVTLPAEK